MKKNIIIGLIIITNIGFSYSQTLPVLEPQLSFELDFSPQSIAHFLSDKAFRDCNDIYNKKKEEEKNKREKYTNEEKNIFFYCDETKDEIWQIEGGGCSWYCGGGPKRVTASSYLSSQGSNTYKPKNAHDLSYETAWVEGVNGYGIGEYLQYTFEAASPRITKIIIVNGYVKSKTTWKNNSRVKRLKMYIDNKPYAILNLKDFYGEQAFTLEPIGNSNRENLEALKKLTDWTLKFEILDVYKGEKFDDVAITEIYFSGLDVHCFAKGTKVLLDDKSYKDIENLIIGDYIAYMDFDTKEIKSAKIEKLENVIHNKLVTYKFESGKEITTTQDHPFKIQHKGWASLRPDKSRQYKGFEEINRINIGDSFITTNSNDKLVAIDFLKGEQETYTISRTSVGDNFIANGLIVGIEELID